MTDALDGTPDPGTVDPSTDQTDLDTAELKKRWVLEIERYERKAQQFEKRGKLILQRYTADKKDEQAKMTTFNLLWSNIQTLKPALYSKDPTPEVERRFKDKDPVGLQASEVLERAATNMLALQHFGDAVRDAVLDRLLPGRGVLWVRYLPHFAKVKGEAPQSENPLAQPDAPAQSAKVNEDALTEDVPDDNEEVVHEEIKFDFVPWTDFGHVVARTWQEIPAVWRICYLDRVEVRKRFGNEIAGALQFDQKPDGLDKDSEGQLGLDKAKIYEIWDKRTRRVIRLSKDHPTTLEVQDDPYELEDFWPLPKPIQATTSSRAFIPTADYILWQDQAKELDRLSHRIAMLTRAVKVVGVYDTSVPALGQLLSGGSENQLVPVDAWAAFAEKGGLKGRIELLDVKQIAEVLLNLYEARDKVKQDIYEISGLSDLLRGASAPEETATAQDIKSRYASVRLKEMQREVQVFARDAIKIAGELMCNLFGDETIKQLSGIKLLTQAEKMGIQQQMQAGQQYQQRAQMLAQQHQQAQQAQGAQPQPGQPVQPGAQPQQPPQQAQFNPAAVLGQPPQPPSPAMMELMQLPAWEEVLGLLRDKPGRNFRIDIETDSTIMQDERAEQEQRMEFAKTVATLVQQAEQIIGTVPELAEAIAETMMLVLRSFKVGRATETAFQEAMDKLVAKAQQPPQPKPSPEVQTEQIKQQGENQRAQGMAQADQQKLIMQNNLQMQLADAKGKQEMQIQQMQLASEEARHRYETDLSHQRDLAAQQQQHEFKMATLMQRGAQQDAAMQQSAMRQAGASAAQPGAI